MRTHAMHRSVWLLVSTLLLACGASARPEEESNYEPAEQPASSSGDELAEAEPEARPQEPEPPAAAPAPKSGPASVRVDATVRGQAVAADVRLIGADGAEAATGRSGEPITVQSGEYTLLVTVSDEAVLLDKPMQRHPLTIEAGESLRESVDFPWAKIQLNVHVNGKPDNGAIVELKRQGAVVGKLKSGGEHTPISPGRYDAEVHTRGAKIPVQGLMFPQGATQSMPVNVQM